jgi:hypothetical protein
MRYTVKHQGVPMGTVELSDRELSAAALDAAPGYDAIRPVIQAGSKTLLQLGFFGAATRPLAIDTAPLAAAAELSFELVDSSGRDVPATFINLIEAPGDERVVVLARLSHAAAGVPARTSPRRGAAPDAA